MVPGEKFQASLLAIGSLQKSVIKVGGDSRVSQLMTDSPLFPERHSTSRRRPLKFLAFFLSVGFCLLLDAVIPNITYRERPFVDNFSTNHGFFFAALLKDNEPIMENWNRELLKTLSHLQSRGYRNLYVSIMENGDSSDATSNYLKELETALANMAIPHTVLTERRVERENLNRIEFLAQLRNLALKPLYSLGWEPKSASIVYLNDIVYSSLQLIKLINTNDGKYDMACALDFFFRFYDTWVARDLRGKKLDPTYPIFWDSTARALERQGNPIRVFSCWNGVAVLKAEPFLAKGSNAVTFRPSAPKQVYHSECFWICYDFWASGFTRILINPQVIVSYERLWYWLQNYVWPIVVNPFQFAYYWLITPSIEVPSSIPTNDRDVPSIAAGWREYL